jgi:16S rRNA (cytidine1402-2'-O)-methyltransferase
MKAQTSTLLFYESPHRLIKTLEGLREGLGDRPAACIRELTKKHEEAVRGSLTECIEWFEEHSPLGEFCIVVEGLGEAAANQLAIDGAWWAELDLAAHVAHYEQQYDRKEAIKRVAQDRGLPKRDVYNEVNRA